MPRQYDITVYTDFGPCARCGNSFTYTFSTRRPKYCPNCGPIVAAEKAEQRRQAYRERHKKEKPISANSGNGKRGTSPSLWGQSKETASLSRSMLSGGMFADMPREAANVRRAAMGLPVLIA